MHKVLSCEVKSYKELSDGNHSNFKYGKNLEIVIVNWRSSIYRANMVRRALL